MKSDILLDTVISIFNETEGWTMRRTSDESGKTRIFVNMGGNELVFLAKVISDINIAALGMLVKPEFNTSPHLPILITKYISPAKQDIIKKLNISFLDSAGNAFINKPPVYINIQGRKLKESPAAIKQGRSAQPAGLQLIFSLLTSKDLITKPLRRIAADSCVGLTTVHKTIQGLSNQGYIVTGPDKKYRLINKEALIKKWAVLYPEKLRPKMSIGIYKQDNHGAFSINMGHSGAVWGGETAAALITNYLKPEFHTIYIQRERFGEFQLRNNLKKDPAGNIEIVEKFWNFSTEYDEKCLAHPILIYADLMSTGDPRNIETANIIYESKITESVR